MLRIITIFVLGVLNLFASSEAILINTIPKSGSVFLVDCMKKNLEEKGYKFLNISDLRFHDSHIKKKIIKRNHHSLFYSQAHLDASPENLKLLSKFLPKFVLHFRDPRQVVLSWYHHVEKHQQNHNHLWSLDIQPPNEYFSWTKEKKLDWQIEHFLPSVVQWMQNWVNILDSRLLQVLVTTFEEMVEDRSTFLQKIFNFYGLDIPDPKYSSFTPGKLHHRNGKKDEWKYEFTPSQKQRMSELVPVELLLRFNWEIESL